MTAPRRSTRAGALLALVACACASARPAAEPAVGDALLWTSRDVSVMVQVDDLEPLMGQPVADARRARWHKERRADGALSLRYDYFSLTAGLGLSWEVLIHRDVPAARAEMARAAAELERHARRDDSEVEIAPDFYAWGDESVFAQVRAQGELGGQYFFARYGAATVSLALAGVYFYEGAQFHQLVHRALSNLLFYHPVDSHE